MVLLFLAWQMGHIKAPITEISNFRGERWGRGRILNLVLDMLCWRGLEMSAGDGLCTGEYTREVYSWQEEK